MIIPEVPGWAEPAVAEYLGRLESQRRLSINTVAAYRRDLAQFFDYCDRNGIDSIERVDRTTARRFLAFLDTRGYARRSLGRKASAVRLIAPQPKSMPRSAKAVLHEMRKESARESCSVDEHEAPP